MDRFITVKYKNGKRLAIDVDNIISFYEICTDPTKESSVCRIEIKYSTIEVEDSFEDLVQKMTWPHIVCS